MKRLLLLISLLLSFSLFANENSDGFYQLKDIRIEEISTNAQTFAFTEAVLAGITLDDIINTGKKVWEIVKANKPIFTHERTWASALPLGVTANELSGWRMPKAHTYRIIADNKFGTRVVDITFKVVFTHGGSLDGKGAYLTNVSVIPVSVDVLWSFTANVNIEVPEVFNMGSKASPVAGMTILVKTEIDTPLQTRDVIQVFTVNGNGEIAEQ